MAANLFESGKSRNKDKWRGFINSLELFTSDFIKDGRCQCVTQEKEVTDSRPNLGHKVVSKKNDNTKPVSQFGTRVGK